MIPYPWAGTLSSVLDVVLMAWVTFCIWWSADALGYRRGVMAMSAAHEAYRKDVIAAWQKSIEDIFAKFGFGERRRQKDERPS